MLEEVHGELYPLTCPDEAGVKRPCSAGAAVARDALLVAHLPPGEYVIVPTTSGCPPEYPVDAPPAELVAPPPERHSAAVEAADATDGLSLAAARALDQACFAYDLDMDGLVGADDLAAPHARGFAEAAGLAPADLREADGGGALRGPELRRLLRRR